MENSTRYTSARAVVMLMTGMACGMTACKDLTGNTGLPAGTPNPSVYNTATGAVGMYNAAVFELERALPQYIIDSGLLTDELGDVETGASAGVLLANSGVANPLDERILSTGVTVASYGSLQAVRTFSLQAIGALATYDTAAKDRATSRALQAGLYAAEGYAEIMLADLFCSGVPLSTIDYQKDFTYAPSSTTNQVYQDAIAKFDTALIFAGDSVQILNLARVGRGRAWMDLGQIDSAAAAVAVVPSSFQYQLAIETTGGTANITVFEGVYAASVSDREGHNGLPYISSGDPRSRVDTANTGSIGNTPLPRPQLIPAKYDFSNYYAPFTLASGVEARLLQAEVALRHGDPATWLTLLNTLRTTGAIAHIDTIQTGASVTIDTVWEAGTGGVSGLRPLTDPGDPVARIDTLFTERAYWLFADGHRQGDLRRLLRQYTQYAAFRSQQQVYPTGLYLAPGTGQYGTDVVAPIPPSENANSLFHGCLTNAP